ncbi:Ras family protein [Tritrichomonas foetus]|uniref:Ras family protein n=1 Tax=Tritrichomonas foetus TaxID=1144522 RepID=A0A1J4K2Y1_9EUKA|nr:Ras family protein [Tritrichomonas foetus]|eukprot:OHT05555.1 Ras family protein [Tritrichomonas foetus]
MSDDEEKPISFKFVLIGDSAVGKTAMCKKFCEHTFDKNQPQTVALEFGTRTIEIEGKKIKLQIWDTAGQERFHSITRAYFRSSTAIFLIYDVTNRDSFSHLSDWTDDAQRLSPPTSIKVLVGNKTDLSDRAVLTEEAQEFATQNGLRFFETSALSGDRIDDTFIQTAHEVYKKMVEGKIDVNAAENILKTNQAEVTSLQVQEEKKSGCGC